MHSVGSGVGTGDLQLHPIAQTMSGSADNGPDYIDIGVVPRVRPPRLLIDSNNLMRILLLTQLLCLSLSATLFADDKRVDATVPLSIVDDGKTLSIRRQDQEIATYVYQHDKVLRPFFANIKTIGGRQVTRNFPPVDGKDATDHETMHPGIWLAFGDLDGADFWRNKARVVHDGFQGKPSSGPGRVGFVQQKKYLRGDGTVVCKESFDCVLHILPEGILIEWDSTFSSDREFYFGDQEEMGLGIRVATPITEVNGGQITDSDGRVGAKNVWSQSSAWCDYSGRSTGQTIGMTILCHADNFRGSWMHARNYGVVAANAFGRKAMKKGPIDRTVVKPGESLRLRYGIFVHGEKPNLDTIHKQYMTIASKD